MICDMIIESIKSIPAYNDILKSCADEIPQFFCLVDSFVMLYMP